MVNGVFELTFLEISKEHLGTNKDAVIVAIYRSHNSNTQELIKVLSSVLDHIYHENKWVYLLGDYNIDLLYCDLHDLTCKFVNSM